MAHKNQSGSEPHEISAYQHIRMISEGSCDTEDWSKDAENSASLWVKHWVKSTQFGLSSTQGLGKYRTEHMLG